MILFNHPNGASSSLEGEAFFVCGKRAFRFLCYF